MCIRDRYRVYSRLWNRSTTGSDNRLNVCIHDTTGCQSSFTTTVSCKRGLTTQANIHQEYRNSTTQNKQKPGLLASYDLRPGNLAGPIFYSSRGSNVSLGNERVAGTWISRSTPLHTVQNDRQSWWSVAIDNRGRILKCEMQQICKCAKC